MDNTQIRHINKVISEREVRGMRWLGGYLSFRAPL